MSSFSLLQSRKGLFVAAGKACSGLVVWIFAGVGRDTDDEDLPLHPFAVDGVVLRKGSTRSSLFTMISSIHTNLSDTLPVVDRKINEGLSVFKSYIYLCSLDLSY